MGSCAAPSAKGDDKFITTDYLQQCRKKSFVECMDVVSIQSVIWLNYFQSPDLLFIEHLREDKNERSEPKRLPFRKLEKTI